MWMRTRQSVVVVLANSGKLFMNPLAVCDMKMKNKSSDSSSFAIKQQFSLLWKRQISPVTLKDTGTIPPRHPTPPLALQEQLQPEDNGII